MKIHGKGYHASRFAGVSIANDDVSSCHSSTLIQNLGRFSCRSIVIELVNVRKLNCRGLSVLNCVDSTRLDFTAIPFSGVSNLFVAAPLAPVSRSQPDRIS